MEIYDEFDIENYKDTIHFVALKYYKQNPRFSFDDLVSEAAIIFYNAVRCYSPDKKAKFKTYLVNALNYELRKFVASNSFDLTVPITKQIKDYRRDGDLSELNETARARKVCYSTNNGDKQEELPILNTVPSGQIPVEEAYDRKEAIEVTLAELESLPDREKNVIKQRYLDCRTLKEIAADLGTSSQTILFWERKGLNILKKRIGQKLCV